VAELRLPPDYADLLRELDAAGAEYVLVGGWAVAVHGHGRATDDLDVFVRATPDNAERVYRALARFGAPLSAHGITPGHFAAPHYGYRVGQKPLLIEILTAIDGVDFDEATREALRVFVDGVGVPVIGRAALLANKRAAGRHKDLADLEALDAIEATRDGEP
jgi:hypothetical protein